MHPYPLHREPRLKKAVVGIDLGFGNVKGFMEDPDGQVTTTFFPSCIEPLDASSQLAEFAAGSADKDGEVHPVVNGKEFRVLTRSTSLSTVARPTPLDDFQQSDEYTALLAAALHSLKAYEIEVLVVGTPIYSFSQHAPELRRKFEGVKNHGLGTVKIQKVVVLPQPFGSLLTAQNTGQIPKDPTLASVIFDVGFRSTDSLCSVGLRCDPKRSIGVPIGMHAVLTRMADVLEKELGQRISKLERIEFALRNNMTLRVRDKDVDIASLCLPQVQPMIDDAIKTIKGKLGTDEDIHIIATGGGAKYFLPALQRAFPGTPIVSVVDPLHSNAKGFLTAAKTTAEQFAQAPLPKQF